MIKRLLQEKLDKHLEAKEISLLIGPRQSGKTTLLKELLSSLQSKGCQVIYFTLDFEPDNKYFASQQALLDKLHLEFGNERAYVFIDEIQLKENAGLFLKGLYDRKLPYKFIVSGSGSLELKEKIHESLAGRKRLFELSTLSLQEFVNYRTGYKYETQLTEFSRIEREYANSLLQEYMKFGAYPSIVLENNISEKTLLMNEIYRSYIEKDH